MEENFFCLHNWSLTWIDQQTYDLAQEYVERFSRNFAEDHSVKPDYTGGDPIIYVHKNIYSKKHYELCKRYIDRFNPTSKVYKMQTYDKQLLVYANDYIRDPRNKYKYYRDLSRGSREAHNAAIDSADELKGSREAHNAAIDSADELKGSREAHNAAIDSADELKVSIRDYSYRTYRFLKRYVDIHYCARGICLGRKPRPPMEDLEVLRLNAELDWIRIDLLLSKRVDKNTQPVDLNLRARIRALEFRLDQAMITYKTAEGKKYIEYAINDGSFHRLGGGRLSRKSHVKRYKKRNSRKSRK
jgi:hypothetical protein